MVRFCTIADAEHYPGLVAMVNSLRIHGHADPVTVLDLGLTDAQRSELGTECDLVRPRPGSSDNPWLLAPQVCRMRPAQTVVYLDCDIIVAAPLDQILLTASRGAICVFPQSNERWFAEWEGIFGLSGPPRHQRYINSGFVAVSTDRFPSLLQRWEECCDRIQGLAGTAANHDRAAPTGFADQDALNALLMSEFDSQSLSVQPAGVVSQGPLELAETRVVDHQRLVCRRGDTPTVLLHSWGLPKPWQPAAGRDLRRTAYLLCLRRLLNGPDVAVQTSQPRVAWLRPGVRGAVALRVQTSYGWARHIARVVVRVLVPRARHRVMEVLRAGAQPVRSVRTAFDRNLRRAYPWKARRVARTSGAAAALFGAAVVLALILGTWIPVVVVLIAFAAEAAQLEWKARPHRGRTRGWAPGSLRPGQDMDVDPGHLTRRARRNGPVFKTWLLNSPTVCIVDLDFARDLFRCHADDLGHAWITVERFVPGGTIREVDGAWYAELRRLRTRALTSTLVRSWEPVLARSVVSQLTALADDVGASGSGISPLPYVRETVLAAWSDTLLGVAPDDPAYAEVSSLVFDLDPDRHIYGHGIPDDEVVIKLDRLAALVESARWNPDGSRGCPSLAARIEEIQPGALADPSIMRDYLFEMINTRDDMSGLLMWVLKYLAEHPTWTHRLRDAEDDQQQLAEQIVSETLRLAQSEYLFRRARTEIEFRGVVIPARWLVRVCLREIHRDPAQFEHAGEFDPDRFADGGCGREVYAPFGIDHHACVGETLTRTFARIFATELVRSFDCETTRDGPVEMSVERHWAPSSRWQVAVRARDAAPAHR